MGYMMKKIKKLFTAATLLSCFASGVANSNMCFEIPKYPAQYSCKDVPKAKKLVEQGGVLTQSNLESIVFDVAGEIVQRNPNHRNVKIALSTGRLLPLLEIAYGKDIEEHLVKWRVDMIKNAPIMYETYRKKYNTLETLETIGLIRNGTFLIEKFIAENDTKPDIFIMDLSDLAPAKDTGILEVLQQCGIQVIVIDFKVNPYENTITSLAATGKALGKEERFKAYIDLYRTKINNIMNLLPEQGQRKSFMIERAAGLDLGELEKSIYAFGNMNIAEYCEKIGLGTNHGAYLLNNRKTGMINFETLLKSPPDVYFLFSASWAKKNKGIPFGYNVSANEISSAFNGLKNRWWLRNLNLYTHNNIHSLDMLFYNSPYNVLAIEYIAKSLYPYHCRAINPDRTWNEIEGFLGGSHGDRIFYWDEKEYG